MKVLLEITDNKMTLLEKWSQEHDSNVLMKSSERLSSEYLNELLDRVNTPLDQRRNAHESV